MAQSGKKHSGTKGFSGLHIFDRIMGQEFLKWLAIIAMTIDHISEHLLSGFQPGRAVGRLAFPLFAMFVAYNYGRFYR